MAEYHEVRHERLYMKEPRTERLRKTATGRLRHMLATGWRETERWHAEDHITVRLERSGVAPRGVRIPKVTPPPPRQGGRGGPGFGRGPGGGFGRGPGGAGGRGPGGPGAADRGSPPR
jgi:hypothetical protein